MTDATGTTRTLPGRRYRCGTCGAEFLITRPGNLPDCCGAPLEPKATVQPPRRDKPQAPR
jgi:DNA-directed RNA polymerase subunit RPC12/RpoP